MEKTSLVILLVLTISINLVAQENTSSQTRKAQITFAYPIGSNGIEAPDYSNKFSFNILYGLNGGVNGFELGSILNYNKGEVIGFQLAGVSNICTDSTSGLFLSGVLNYSKQNSKGFQMSTINFTAEKFTGFQLGVVNYAKELNGIQLGVVNYAKELNGIQLGVINILNDSRKALPIGIISIVKNGFFEFELTGGEVIYSNLNYKMGVERFYTIFKTGYSYYKNNPVYSYGIGFGSNISISEKHKLNVDLSGNKIVYNNKWDGKLDLLNKVDFNYKYNVSRNLSLLVGPSFNVYITK